MHPICHKTIHKTFTNAELARFGDDQEVISLHDDIAKFLQWIADKPPDFRAPVSRSR